MPPTWAESAGPSARFAKGEEGGRYWTALKVQVPTYAKYEKRTTREIPVVVLESP